MASYLEEDYVVSSTRSKCLHVLFLFPVRYKLP